MRHSVISAALLTAGFIAAAPIASASCMGPMCGVNGYGTNDSYTPSHTSSTRYSSTSSYSSSAPLGSYGGHSSYSSHNSVPSYSGTSYSISDHEADMRYGSGSVSNSYTLGDDTIVPFTTTTASDSGFRVPGMGSNEFLSPTECPVSVYNPQGGKVLGCYSVSKPAPVKVHVPAPVTVTVPTYRTVNVVRPIIYVRYPVPTPVAVPIYSHQYNYGYSHHRQYSACGNSWNSRYGENWPGRGCR